MKISLKWLNEYVDVSDFFAKPEVLSDVLTKAGLEVEEIQNKAKDYENVVTALILEKGKHPNADKLSLCQVTTGEGVVHQIVCGAQNHKTGDKVILALPGAILPGNFKIAKAVVRGVDSGGMLCSFKELGLNQEGAEKNEGIVICDPNTVIGIPAAKHFGLDDVTFELKVTPNRADCLSHYGLAREVSALLSRTLKAPRLKKNYTGGKTTDKITVEVLDAKACPRYMGRVISGIKVGPSPEWLKKRLEILGMKSINNVVDVTNFVMMELGQPLHAFDASRIRGRKVVVGPATEAEKFVTLDGTTLSLKSTDLVIRDAEGAMCVAGVIGGKNSGTTENTTEVFLESAYFSPLTVRTSSRGHGITTDSGYRFSRGVDVNITDYALDRATDLILEVAGGEAASEAFEFYPLKTEAKEVEISLQMVSDRLGYAASEDKFLDFMKRLGCQVQAKTAGLFSLRPPSFRHDLEIPMDFVEEYARLNGYEHIPETLPAFASSPSNFDSEYLLTRKVSSVLRGEGYQEALNFAFCGAVAEKKFIKTFEKFSETGLLVKETPVRLVNPLNEDLDVMRSTISFGLYRNVVANVHQGNLTGRLFETGQTFSLNLEQDTKYHQEPRWALAAWGKSEGLYPMASTSPLVFEVKEAVDHLLSALGYKNWTWVQPSDKGKVLDFMHPGQTAYLELEGKRVGFLGHVHPTLLEAEKIRSEVCLAEFKLSALMTSLQRTLKIERISRFPSIERDLALVMPISLRAGQIAEEIKKQAGPLLVSLEVFDVYQGEKLPLGQKSVAYRLKYQDKNATLQDQLVQDSVQKVLSSLKEKFEITVR
jgi:phenylalanyl-tRNA synthetase beta chain